MFDEILRDWDNYDVHVYGGISELAVGHTLVDEPFCVLHPDVLPDRNRDLLLPIILPESDYNLDTLERERGREGIVMAWEAIEYFTYPAGLVHYSLLFYMVRSNHFIIGAVCY